MKGVVRKSAIPESRAFIIRELSAPYFDRSLHFHPEYQLFLVLEGRGTRFVGDNIKSFKENELAFLGPNLPHLWRSDNKYFEKNSSLQTKGIVIYFQEDFLGGYIQQKEELEVIHHLFQRSKLGLDVSGNTKECISRMMIDLLHLKGAESIIQLLSILDVLSNSTEYEPIAHAGYVNLSTESETDRMGEVYEHIMKNFKNRISLEEVASIANMSLSSFNRYFKSRANKSFSDFLSEIRISYACKLLNEEDMSITQVCYESGFNTLSNFNRQFKDFTGCTPMQYKKEHTRLHHVF